MTKIMAFCDYFLPGFKAGGPIATVRNMAVRLSPGLRFRVVTRDRDLGDTAPYSDIVPGRWSIISGVEVIHLSPMQQTISRYRDLIDSEAPSFIYLNSFFSRRFTLLPLIALRFLDRRIPVVLAPRGEFSVAAQALRKRQKVLYRQVLAASGLLRNVVWQASTCDEARDITRLLGADATIRIAPDLSAEPAESLLRETTKLRGVCNAVFIGRISPMKNINWLLEIVRDSELDVRLTLYGPVEDERYWESCQNLIRNITGRFRVSYGGLLSPGRVPAILREADALVLPSRGENFGHVVAEALAVGCLVITSDRTPWQEIARSRAGWVLPLEQPAAWLDAFKELVAMSEEEHLAMRGRAWALSLRRSGAGEQLAPNFALFTDIAAPAS